MAYHRLVISDTPYLLEDRQVRDDLVAAIITAVRVGGDFVRIPAAGERNTHVLVTPATAVRIEELSDEDRRRSVAIDFDLGWIDYDTTA